MVTQKKTKPLKMVRHKGKKIELVSKDGLPLMAKLKVDGKSIPNAPIVRYKETPCEKQLIIVTYDQYGHEHQMFYGEENEINIDYRSMSGETRLVCKNNKSEIFYKSRNITEGVRKILCQLEVPTISSLELVY